MKSSIIFALFTFFGLVRSTYAAESGPQYYATIFGSEGAPDHARESHTFATFVHVENEAVTEELTISWLPAPGYFAEGNTMPPLATVPGHNYTLDETLALARGHRVKHWGPYQITPELYEKARQRIAFLKKGNTGYKMFVLSYGMRAPALSNQGGGAINCIMAVSDLGGMLDTGTDWGFVASQRVVVWLERWIPGYMSGADTDVANMMRLNERLSR